MTERTKKRVTVSLSVDAAAALELRGGDNASAYVERLVMRDALAASLASHAEWFARNPAFAEVDEAERNAA